jgi:hypothetical protein
VLPLTSGNSTNNTTKYSTHSTITTFSIDTKPRHAPTAAPIPAPLCVLFVFLAIHNKSVPNDITNANVIEKFS